MCSKRRCRACALPPGALYHRPPAVESTLDLETVDETPFKRLFDALNEAGIQFRSLADFGNSPQARRQAVQRSTHHRAGDPGYSGEFIPYDEFEKEVCSSEWFQPEGQLMAMEGDECIGLSRRAPVPRIATAPTT